MTGDSSLVTDSPIKVRMLRVDGGRRRISLSLRQIEKVALLPAEQPHLRVASPLVEDGTQ
jgi:ribosomal protein S1